MLYGPQVWTVALLVVVWTLATTALLLRLVARRMTKAALWFDDYFCFAAYAFCTAHGAGQLVCKKETSSWQAHARQQQLLDLTSTWAL